MLILYRGNARTDYHIISVGLFTLSITMPMDAHQLKVFLPDIRSRILQTQTTRNLHKQLLTPPGDPIHTSVHSFPGINFLPKIRQPRNAQAGQPFPIRPEVSSKLSMTNQMNLEMREADRRVKVTELRSKMFESECIPTKANLMQRGMLQGRAFRLPALGATKAARSPTPDLNSSLSLMCKRAESRKSADHSEPEDCNESIDTRNSSSSSLSIEPYPFSEDDDDFKSSRDDTVSPEHADRKNVKLPVVRKQKRPKKTSPKPKVKPKLPDPAITKVKRKKVKQRSWKHVRPVKDLTPLKFAAPTAYDKELEKLLPERKSFFYSSALERELRRHIPPRLPGGKLKPVYKRTADGEIYLPKHPLNIKSHQLVDGSAPREGGTDEQKTLTRRPGEDLPSFNARKRRWEMQEEIKKNTAIVSFKEYSNTIVTRKLETDVAANR